MGKVIDKTYCPKCNSTDNLRVYEQEDGSQDGSCFTPGCGYYTKDPYSGEVPMININTMATTATAVKRDPMADMLNVSGLPDAGLPDRGIPAHITALYGIKIETDPYTGGVGKHYYPHEKDGNVQGYKVRTCNPKGFGGFGTCKGHDMLGTSLASTCSKKFVVITEGECDMAAVQMAIMDARVGSKMEGQPAAVLSLKDGGGGAAKDITDQYEFLEQFDKVIYVGDNDKAGKVAFDAAMSAIPEGKAYYVKVPASMKDANDMTQAGRGRDLARGVVWEPVQWVPERFVTARDVADLAKIRPSLGYDFPWEPFNEKSYGIHPGIYMVGAGSGVGKTTWMLEITDYMVSVHRVPVGLWYLEQTTQHTVQKLAGIRYNKAFHLPDGDYTQQELDDAVEAVANDNLVHMYKREKYMDPLQTVTDLALQAKIMGVKFAVLDNLTVLTAGQPEERTLLDKLMEQLAGMVLKYDMALFIVSHLNRSEGGHESGQRVQQHHFRGSGSLQFWPNAMIGLERDTNSPRAAIRNMTNVRWIKDRFSGKANGMLQQLYYNVDQGRMLVPTAAEKYAYDTAKEAEAAEAKRAKQGAYVGGSY